MKGNYEQWRSEGSREGENCAAARGSARQNDFVVAPDLKLVKVNKPL